MLKVTQLVSGIAPSAFLKALRVTGRDSPQEVRGEVSPACGLFFWLTLEKDGVLDVMMSSEVTAVMFWVWKPDFPLQPRSWSK